MRFIRVTNACGMAALIDVGTVAMMLLGLSEGIVTRIEKDSLGEGKKLSYPS